MKTHPTLIKAFLPWTLLLLLSAIGQAQTFTNSYGVWDYTPTNGAIAITGFYGSGSVFTGSNAAVTIPSSINGLTVTTIDANACYGNYMSLLSVTIPNTVTTIGNYAFAECTYLTNVLIGGSVTRLGDYVFEGCSDLRAVYFLGNAPANGNDLYVSDRNLTNYYLSYLTGWTSTFSGAPAVPWTPPLPALDITTYGGQPVLVFPLPAAFPASIGTNYIVQMTTNLASGNWVTLTNCVPLISLQVTNAPSHAFFRLQ
jgi:hypothetical protein